MTVRRRDGRHLYGVISPRWGAAAPAPVHLKRKEGHGVPCPYRWLPVIEGGLKPAPTNAEEKAKANQAEKRYRTGSAQFSRVSFTLWRNWWAMAPSTTRWS